MKIVLLTVLILWSSSSTIAQPKEIDPPSALRATVTEKFCEFWFPEKNANGKWSWNNEQFGTSKNEWHIEVIFDGQTYLIGFSDGIDHPLNENRGPLTALLAAGFSCIWRQSWEPTDSLDAETEDGKTLVARVVTKEGFSTTKHNNGVLVRVTNPKWVRRFLTERPEKVVFCRSVLGEYYEKAVRVDYRDDVTE